jgi:FSR family fosmidomycin resistance protein-like MFS transporter
MLTTHPASLLKTSSKPMLLAGLTLGHMVNDFYTTILPPLIPALVPVFGLSYVQIGLLSLCFSILSGLLQPTIGHLSDTLPAEKKRSSLAF